MKAKISTVILKLVSTCNLKCTYCYWFRNDQVREYPNVLRSNVKSALLKVLDSHFERHKPKEFSIIFHGGEPLLYGQKNFSQICGELRDAAYRHGVMLNLGITTNGMLIDEEWIRIFKAYNVSVSVSIDSTKESHDRHRVDFKNVSSYSKVTAGIKKLLDSDISPGLISVCDPSADPADVLRHFVDQIGASRFNVLIPDYVFDDKPMSIAPFYKGLFDLWHDTYAAKSVDIPILRNMLRTVLGKSSSSESIGGGPNTTVTINTDGRIEHHDALNIIPKQSKNMSHIYVQTHELQDIVGDQWWQEVFAGSTTLAPKCSACELNKVCGGGFVVHRWSQKNGFANPSVYCDDYIEIYTHIYRKISSDLYYVEQASCE